MSEPEDRREDHDHEVDLLVAGLEDDGYEVGSRLVVDLPDGALRTRVEFVDTRLDGAAHLLVGRARDEGTLFSARSVFLRTRELRVEEILPTLRWNLSTARPRPFTPNADFARLVELLRAVGTDVLDELPSLSIRITSGVDLALLGREAPPDAVAVATSILTDLAAGAPAEWALRRAECAS